VSGIPALCFANNTVTHIMQGLHWRHAPWHNSIRKSSHHCQRARTHRSTYVQSQRNAASLWRARLRQMI